MTTKARPVRKLLADAEEKILAIRDDEVQIPAHKLVLASVMQHLLHVNLEDKCAVILSCTSVDSTLDH